MNPARYRIVLDSGMCTGHGRCYAETPQLFEPDEQGFGVATTQVIDEDRLPQARKAESACPERAINVTAIDETRTEEKP
jgi:ferredoxin